MVATLELAKKIREGFLNTPEEVYPYYELRTVDGISFHAEIRPSEEQLEREVLHVDALITLPPNVECTGISFVHGAPDQMTGVANGVFQPHHILTLRSDEGQVGALRVPVRQTGRDEDENLQNLYIANIFTRPHFLLGDSIDGFPDWMLPD